MGKVPFGSTWAELWRMSSKGVDLVQPALGNTECIPQSTVIRTVTPCSGNGNSMWTCELGTQMGRNQNSGPSHRKRSRHVMPRSWIYPGKSVMSSKASKQMNDLIRFLFSEDDPGSNVGNEWEGEGTEVLGGSGRWGRDYVCHPSHPIWTYGKEIFLSLSHGFLPVPEREFFRA